ncbi:SWI/SNF-related matrix-associated actin-dependent regulator of chromatin subfamily A containing DEAD/H box 1 homolog [Pollicipes pollicipes]|uniref:SWI/SNF-related matrix-associated actin-dependent regulator of chromatin subfamily A containing DEAD/H box 1 homolog n=1 Tax=Pollicipes pollicipes TaxID=41117 RepID=UPI0018857029|nr:SWI/SNF-related matrix-associated actin-dependent regulator of chromatin subfamily A containing DEAD/H box 1 homolog [Pollicipes pollicipes]XP_037083119.1 SWI/SNF-related matrix-associated actin-dependent regulator of chromatin subfamily A containing DEAD/H box 1 homolog [Pollicipes pollicipes]XP_037083120.1 SWI/SNF-related matrix-associated actin-dependent regulator of chromatin subfamily A containing DEAD/H box 1 homolog [Pollicipes pollicipes]XP_037083121.1 SWI/SNF-related matrix-associate
MSQSLLSDLKRFRYQKRPTESAGDASQGMGQEPSTATEPSECGLTSPVIGRRRVSSCHSADGDSPVRRRRISSCHSGDGDMLVVKKRPAKRCVLSDSEDDGEEEEKEKEPEPAPAPDPEPTCPSAPDSPRAIDRNLAFMQEAFPDADAMELQDCLAQHGWCLEPAMAALVEKAGDRSPETAPQPAAAAARPAVKRRRLVLLESDSSDEDGKPAAPASNGLQNGAARAATNGLPKSKPKPKPARRPPSEAAAADDSDDEDFEAKCVVYMSDSDDDEDEAAGGGRRRPDGLRLAADRRLVVQYLDSATTDELACINGCSRKKAELIVQQRPFADWSAALARFMGLKGLNPQMLNATLRVLRMRQMLDRLLQRCGDIALKLKARVAELVQGRADQDKITEQPSNLNSEMRLSPYQLIGLSWLIIMFKEGLNAVLADEMGLGKTIQAISFLAYLQQQNAAWKYLVVVPSSTLDNWVRELSVWCPSLSVVEYRGSLEQRRDLRQLLLREQHDWQVVVTTYNTVASSPEDRMLFRNLSFKYIVFDEAHMLKNMGSKRYTNLMRLIGEHRLLLTGTPLQNNLLELMSLLVFVMPHMFGKFRQSLQTMFEVIPKASGQESRSSYEAARISEAKRIMSPFFLRRLKRDVLVDLPAKREEVRRIAMTAGQAAKYRQLRDNFVRETSDKLRGSAADVSQTGIGLVMSMRKLANHPLLLRHYYDDAKLREITKIFVAMPDHEHKEEALVLEDLTYMSDFEIHQTCKLYPRLRGHQLPDQLILDSGKCAALDQLLPQLKRDGSRVLLFSQFVIMLDVLEAYLRLRGHKYCRLDGQTAVTDRLELIDKYNSERDIFVFLLSTRAGGLGINLTSANVVILHDVDFNPHNDRQAEDRCHRIGQTREVQVIKLICANSIDECMLQVGQEKLSLDRDISGGTDAPGEAEDPRDVRHLLELALACGDG